MHNPTPSTLALLTSICTALLTVMIGCGDDTQYRTRNVPNAPSNNTEAAPDDTSNSTNTDPEASWCPVGGDKIWHQVQIEDMSEIIDDDAYPGVAIDAIELVTEDGQRHFATAVEDFNLGGGVALDTLQTLGPPDADCEERSGFVSMGGREAGGYIIVSFGDLDQDSLVAFSKGATITVHTANTTCGADSANPNARYTAGVRISSDAIPTTMLDGEHTGTTTLCVDHNTP